MQLELPIFELPIYPNPLFKPHEFAFYMLKQAEQSFFCEHKEWLIQWERILMCCSVIPSFTFERMDGQPWDRRTLIAYGHQMFRGKPFREISLYSATRNKAGGWRTVKIKSKAELTPNMDLKSNNFKELWRHENLRNHHRKQRRSDSVPSLQYGLL